MREVTLPIEGATGARDFESFFRAEYRSLCQAHVLLVGDAFAGATWTEALGIRNDSRPAKYPMRWCSVIQRL